MEKVPQITKIDQLLFISSSLLKILLQNCKKSASKIRNKTLTKLFFKTRI